MKVEACRITQPVLNSCNILLICGLDFRFKAADLVIDHLAASWFGYISVSPKINPALILSIVEASLTLYFLESLSALAL